MSGLSAIEALCVARGLAVLGGFRAELDPDLPKGTQTLLLLGPHEPGFWATLTASPEWDSHRTQTAPDPVDRWSRRVIGSLACDLGAKALFPFGARRHPFFAWALRSGRCHQSPVRLLVHDEMGLWVSFRGALALKEALDLPPPGASPCQSCAGQPCLTACPVGALTEMGYDVPACHGFLDRAEGQACMAEGCAVRRACPLSHGHARMPEQSAYHMRQFHT